jgi:hypothetical protein
VFPSLKLELELELELELDVASSCWVITSLLPAEGGMGLDIALTFWSALPPERDRSEGLEVSSDRGVCSALPPAGTVSCETASGD